MGGHPGAADMSDIDPDPAMAVVVTAALLDAVAARGECDFVTDIATPLPLWTLSELLGVPEADRADIIRWSNEALALLDPDYFASPDAGQHVFVKLFEYGKRMMALRREQPAAGILVRHPQRLHRQDQRVDRELGQEEEADLLGGVALAHVVQDHEHGA